jgi:DNA-binding NtrC family response regulator
MPTVLIIDDNPAVRTALEVLLELHSIGSITASSPREGLDLLRHREIDVVIQDMNFADDTTSGAEGGDLFRSLRELDPEMPVVLLTAWTHLEQAVSLVRAGAADYLEKPWNDDKLITTVRNLLDLASARHDRRRLLDERTRERVQLAEAADLCGLVYESAALHEVVTTAVRIAPTDVPVLITGPNGVGKEKIADIVQANSQRRQRPYLKVNLGALPTELLESELFGAEAGAFTGATRARKGRFETADGGTLFLDEIGELPLSGQVKLLRVLQTGEFERLGSSETRTVDVRILSATNTDLVAAVREGRFREDLYYRLNVIELRIPPLAHRPDDIVPIALHFLREPFELTPAARQALRSYPWPGNIRELSNRIQRAMLLANRSSIAPAQLDLEPDVTALRPVETEPTKVDILRALDDSDWTISVAARVLGLTRQALYRRLEKHGIQRDG